MVTTTHTVKLDEDEIEILLATIDTHIVAMVQHRDSLSSGQCWEQMDEAVLAAEDLYYKLDDTTTRIRKPRW